VLELCKLGGDLDKKPGISYWDILSFFWEPGVNVKLLGLGADWVIREFVDQPKP